MEFLIDLNLMVEGSLIMDLMETVPLEYYLIEFYYILYYAIALILYHLYY